VTVRSRARMYRGTSLAGMPALMAGSNPADCVCAPVGSRASDSSININSPAPADVPDFARPPAPALTLTWTPVPPVSDIATPMSTVELFQAGRPRTAQNML